MKTQNSCTFQDIVEFYDHLRVPLSTLERDKKQGEYPYYGAQEIIDHIDDFIFEGEYILIAEDGANLMTYNKPIAQIVRGKFWVNNHAHIVKAKENISTNYFANILLNSMNIKGYVTGVAQPKLSQNNLRNIKINIPLFDSQLKITNILSSYDDLIDANSRRIQLLEESARILFREWFVHFKFPGHEKVKIVDGVPEGWKRGKVKDIGVIVTGKTPSTKNVSNFNGAIPFIKTPDMHKSPIIINTEESLSETGANSQKNKYLPPRSILVSCIGTVGIVAMNWLRAQTNQQINSIIPKKEIYRYYSFFYLSRLKPLLEAIGGGSTMANINKNKFEGLDVFIPPGTILESFDRIVDPVFNQIAFLLQQNQKLEQARDLLLPRLMSGVIEV